MLISELITNLEKIKESEGDIEVVLLRLREDVLEEEGGDGRDHLHEIILEGILPLDLQRAAVELPLLVEVIAHVVEPVPAGAVLGEVHAPDEFRVENPVHQVVLVPEMVIEALPVDPAVAADIRHAYFLEGPRPHEFFHGGRKGVFGDV